MKDIRYYGTYARFDTVSAKEAGALMGPDNIVGDRFSITLHEQDGTAFAWLQNRFGAEIGYLDAATSRQVRVFMARGWYVHALLSFIAFTESASPSPYWGEVVLMCFDPTYAEVFGTFMRAMGQSLAEGRRPSASLSEQEINLLIAKEGKWLPSSRTPIPEKKTGTVIMKQRMKFSEKVIEQGRRNNVGCYILTWIIIAALICVSALVLANFL